LSESFAALRSAIAAAYKLAPAAVIVALLLSAIAIWIAVQWTPLMLSSAALLVVVVSLGIFAARGDFGESILSLVGGLLAVFAIDWTVGYYIAFMASWLGFSFFAILIASLKIASKAEDIYRMAALRIAEEGEDHEPIESRLRSIGESRSLKMLGPIERAEIIRVLAFRKVPIDLFEPCLKAVEILSTITKCDNQSISIFVSDFILSFKPDTSGEATRLVDTLYDVIRDVPVPPEEFFRAFARSRRLLISQVHPPIEFLNALRRCLTSGYAADEIHDELLTRFASDDS